MSTEQVKRLFERYRWAEDYCRGRDVVEIACGSGQGLGYLARVARSVVGGDISPQLVAMARKHYGTRVEILELDAQALPFENQSKDVILLFEAIYYLPAPEKFLRECARVLRPEGHLLIATANKDLFDFNPSPHSYEYFGVVELNRLVENHGFTAKFFGNTPFSSASLKQRLLRPVKKVLVDLNLMPKTMAGKKLMKRLVFGKLVPMPAEVTPIASDYTPPTPLTPEQPDRSHKALFCAACLTPTH